MNKFPESIVDVIVVGGGGGGLTAALTAAASGMAVELIESEEGVGGTTLFSGGQVWIPNNHLMRNTGIADSREDALDYLQSTMPNRNDNVRWDAFVDNAPKMLRFLENNSSLRFSISECPDTFVELLGGKKYGRTVETKPFHLRSLGHRAHDILKLPAEFRVQLPLTFKEVMKILQYGRLAAIPLSPVLLGRMITRRVCMSHGLVAGLLHGCLKSGVRISLNTRVVELIREDGRVSGVISNATPERRIIRARQGVILATGSFDWNEELKREFLPAPLEHSVTPPSNRGDAVTMARQVGAKLAHMDEAWYWPVQYTGSVYKQAPLGKILRRRAYPHTLAVNAHGKRFANESCHNMALSMMYEKDRTTGDPINQPAWLISDNQYRKSYEDWATKILQPEWLIRGETIADLAAKINLDSQILQNTIDRFNHFAKRGEDPDFNRNKSYYDRVHGDHRAAFESLGTIEDPPFFAVRIHAGSVGTKGGPMTNAKWQVIGEHGDVINGLYAVGNCSATIIGPGTIAPAGTLGPALTAGYIAGRQISADPNN